VPVAVTLPAAATQIAVGGSESDNGQTVVLLASGLVYGWGNNTWQQLDAFGPATQDTPMRLATPARATFTALASGGGTIYAIDSAGDLWAQGQSEWGQAGDGRTENANPFTVVAAGIAFISATARNEVAVQGT
jgi:alpha-tubulin suppressor-like RCC1 family protein